MTRSPLEPLVLPTIRGLARSVVALELGPDRVDRALFLEETARALFRKIELMPPHLGAGMIGLTLAFAASTRARTGRPFGELPPERQRAVLDAWKYGPLSPTRDFVRFYEKMGVFIWYSLLEDAGIEPGEVPA